MVDDPGPVARAATVRDVPEIARVCAAGWRDTYAELKPAGHIERMITEFYGTERIATEIAARGEEWCGYVVAEVDGRVIAAGGGGLTAPGIGELFVLYADPARRRRRGGSAVLAHISDQQRALGAREQWVSVEPGNEKGLPFYRAQGFTERGSRAAYRGEGSSLRLARSLR